MGVHSGKFGQVTVGGTHPKSIRNWSLNHITKPSQVVTSITGFGTQRTAGFADYSGSYQQWADDPAAMPGTIAAGVFYTAPSDDTEGNAGTTYTGNIIIDSVTITMDWTGSPALTIDTAFSGSGGGLTEATSGADFDDASTDLVDTICDMKLQTGVSPADWDNIQRAVLTITSNNPAVDHSGASCFTTRKAGTIDWTLTVTETNDQEDLPIGTNIHLWMFTDVGGSREWELKWGHLIDYTNLVVNRETGEFISRDVNFAMVAHDGSTLGRIKRPGETVSFWWGV